MRPTGPADPASTLEVAVLKNGLRLRGAIDLVEKRAADGKVRVTDHKSGKVWMPEGAVVNGGENLQPILYTLAYEALTGEEVESARLYFVTQRAGYAERVVRADEEALEGGGRVPEAPRRGDRGGILSRLAPGEAGLRIVRLSPHLRPEDADRRPAKAGRPAALPSQLAPEPDVSDSRFRGCRRPGGHPRRSRFHARGRGGGGNRQDHGAGEPHPLRRFDRAGRALTNRRRHLHREGRRRAEAPPSRRARAEAERSRGETTTRK